MNYLVNLFDRVAAQYMPRIKPPQPRRSKSDRRILKRRRTAYRVAKLARRLERDRQLIIPMARPQWDDLQDRLQQYAWLYACGHRTRAICDMMGISPRTVYSMRYRLTRRMRMTMVTIAHWVRDQGLTIREPLDYLDRVRYKDQYMARTKDLSKAIESHSVAIIEELRELSEHGPRLKAHPAALDHTVKTLTAEFNAAMEHLRKGTAPQSSISFALPPLAA